MRKPLAILKDSFQEAKDSKTLLIMMILGSFFLVVVASIGYITAKPEPVFDSFAKGFSQRIVLNRGKKSIFADPQMTSVTLANAKISQFKVLKDSTIQEAINSTMAKDSNDQVSE